MSQEPQPVACAVCERLMALDSEYLCAHFRQDRCRIAAARSDFKHAVAGRDLCGYRH
jgi:hypothetical protein